MSDKKLTVSWASVGLNFAVLAVFYALSYVIMSINLGGSPIHFSFGGLLYLVLAGSFSSSNPLDMVVFHAVVAMIPVAILVLLLWIRRYDFTVMRQFSPRKLLTWFILACLLTILIGASLTALFLVGR